MDCDLLGNRICSRLRPLTRLTTMTTMMTEMAMAVMSRSTEWPEASPLASLSIQVEPVS